MLLQVSKTQKMKPNVCLVKCLLNSIAFKLTRDKFKGIKKIQYCILLNVQNMLIVLFHLHKLLFIYTPGNKSMHYYIKPGDINLCGKGTSILNEEGRQLLEAY